VPSTTRTMVDAKASDVRPQSTGAVALFLAPLRASATRTPQQQASIEYPLGYLRGLDGMRGVMALIVIEFHAGLLHKFIPGALVVVDVFFVVSGYLITSILVKDFTQNGRIQFGKFYLRRFLRLYPALAAMLVTYMVFSYLKLSQFHARVIDAASYLIYIGNYFAVIFDRSTLGVGHLWSLAVEEHFYLFWPMVLSPLLIRWGASHRTALLILLLAAAFWLFRIVWPVLRRCLYLCFPTTTSICFFLAAPPPFCCLSFRSGISHGGPPSWPGRSCPLRHCRCLRCTRSAMICARTT
jgi:peptidoglycan/LPS O-acetylase OafA/YrhL